MSNIVLQPNSSGTGSITIATPNTNTDRTLNIPDVAGNLVTTGDSATVTDAMMHGSLNLSAKTLTMPTGHIIQRVVKVSEYQQFKEQLDDGKMIDCSWCGNQTCEDKIKEETGADIRVIPSDNTKAETCIYCKNSGTTNVLFARGY